MIQVDISNIWSALSLRDLLGLEQAVFQAHLRLGEGFSPAGITIPETLDRLLDAARRIREESDVLIVIGGDEGAQGILELLQGSHRNLLREEREPQIFFTGKDFSTRSWNQLQHLIDGKDFSLCVIGGSRESAISFRNLKWRLERRYGTDESRQRIFAVTAEDAPLHQMAREEGWETFVIPGTADVLSPAGLLPLAAAGIDIRTLLRGAEAAAEEFDLRSYENPVWLYTAARHLLGGQLSQELLRTGEPDFSRLGRWWQQLFAGAGSLFPAYLELIGIQHGGSYLETILRFDLPEQKAFLWPDVKDLDGLNHLSGSTLDQVEESAFQSLLESHSDLGLPLITIDCGVLDTEALGQLLWFFLLSSSLGRNLLPEDT